jgi:hypothetical protein
MMYVGTNHKIIQCVYIKQVKHKETILHCLKLLTLGERLLELNLSKLEKYVKQNFLKTTKG